MPPPKITVPSLEIELNKRENSSTNQIYNCQIYHQVHATLAEITVSYKNNYSTKV